MKRKLDRKDSGDYEPIITNEHEMIVRPRYVSDPRPYDLADAAAILKQHNVWRRWNGDWDEEDGPEPVGPSELGRAIDMVVAHIESLTPACPPVPQPSSGSRTSG